MFSLDHQLLRSYVHKVISELAKHYMYGINPWILDSNINLECVGREVSESSTIQYLVHSCSSTSIVVTGMASENIGSATSAELFDSHLLVSFTSFAKAPRKFRTMRAPAMAVVTVRNGVAAAMSAGLSFCRARAIFGIFAAIKEVS